MKSLSAERRARDRRVPLLLPVFLIAGFLLSVVFGLPCAAGETGGAPPAPKAILSTAPDFTGRGVDGKTYRLQELLEQGPVLLDFWTTWCKPCMQELPHLQKLWEAHKGQGFTVLGVASDDQRTAAGIKPLVQSKGLKFPVVTDGDRKIGNLYNVRNYPTTVLIAMDGSVVSLAQGYRPGDEKELEKKVMALLSRGTKSEKSSATEPAATETSETKSAETGSGAGR